MTAPYLLAFLSQKLSTMKFRLILLLAFAGVAFVKESSAFGKGKGSGPPPGWGERWWCEDICDQISVHVECECIQKSTPFGVKWLPEVPYWFGGGGKGKGGRKGRRR